jgi:tyrosyl-tRNA synthetase
MTRSSTISIEKEIQILERHCEKLFPRNGLEEKLRESQEQHRPLMVKLGLDPTAPDIHLGHTVVLKKLRDFQDCGHTVVLIIGNFTATIGDPSGRSKTRPILSEEEIQKNAATYKKQAEKILDVGRKKFIVRRNSEWLTKLSLSDFFTILAKTTVSQILARDDFRARNQKNDPIGLHELLYPILQGYDSCAIRADIEIGGTDQTFNLLMGREIQKQCGLSPQVVLTMPLLPGTDGKQKMSKSLQNAIGIMEDADQMYGKLMSIPDHCILPYMRLVSDISERDIPKKESDIQGAEMQMKQRLAFSVTRMYGSESDALMAQDKFRKTFQQKSFPSDAPIVQLKKKEVITRVLVRCGACTSNSEARRKVLEGAVKVDGKKIIDPYALIAPGSTPMKLQVGKRRYYRVIRQNKII